MSEPPYTSCGPEDLALAAEAEMPARMIQPADDGSWQPAEDGLYAALLPVYDDLGDGGLVDILAWELVGTGSPWWRRIGAVDYLGAPALHRARLLDRPLRLVATPHEWLQDRGEAVCILDWRIDARELLEGVPEIVCSRPALRVRLERALVEPQRRMPRVA